MKNSYTCPTPVGTVTIVEQQGAIIRLYFGTADLPDTKSELTPLIKKAAAQLHEYFDGSRKNFDLPLKPSGTPFQEKVWAALATIPYGQTASYARLAAMVGNPKACRAVGGANNRNPLAIFIPCHRVIGANGQLVGYAGGLEIKKRLLEIEMAK
ncbi:MAG: methylated-DNA--[protein]-cysteine S-methyltransferase [Alistipes sp.]|nr:methylated-DNA--[protein]-cysteine S-methyltransferase [Alistipes sp.]